VTPVTPCDVSASASASELTITKEDTIKNIIELWNVFAENNGLTKIEEINKGSQREAHLRARMSKKGFDFNKLLEAVGQSPFLLGQAGKEPFYATFDWILCSSNYQKIVEGNYKQKEIKQEEDKWLKWRKEQPEK
jgi:hypothetical protein